MSYLSRRMREERQAAERGTRRTRVEVGLVDKDGVTRWQELPVLHATFTPNFGLAAIDYRNRGG